MIFDDDTDEREQFREKSAEVSRILRERRYDSVTELEKLGFTYVSGGDDDASDIAEEQAATANTEEQKQLVMFFEANSSPSDELVSCYVTELEKDEPNYPLFRRYFRQGSAQLIALLHYGLDKNPTNPDLLNGLGFYHVFSPILKELIAYYTKACEAEQDMTRFRQLAQDFHINCSASGYEALHALDEKLQKDDPKKVVLKDLMSEWSDNGITL